MVLTIDSFAVFIQKLSQRLQAYKDLLNDLDNKIGDGDHGTNMARGFAAAHEKLQSSKISDVGNACKIVAMTLLGTIGGASGPLYGTIFMRFAAAWKDLVRVDMVSFTNGIQSALAGIKERGKASTGDKTMVDVWKAVHTALEKLLAEELQNIHAIVNTAQQAANSSRDLAAKRGRAAYLGDLSKGTCDPGSISSAIFFEELMDATIGGVEKVEWQTLVL